MLIYFVTSFVVIGAFVGSLLSKTELSIDSYMNISYVNMNKGDAKIIKKCEDKNKKSIYSSIYNLFGAIAIGFISNFFYSLVKDVLF